MLQLTGWAGLNKDFSIVSDCFHMNIKGLHSKNCGHVNQFKFGNVDQALKLLCWWKIIVCWPELSFSVCWFSSLSFVDIWELSVKSGTPWAICTFTEPCMSKHWHYQPAPVGDSIHYSQGGNLLWARMASSHSCQGDPVMVASPRLSQDFWDKWLQDFFC